MSTFAELVRAKSGGEVIIEASYDAAKGIKSGDMIAAVQTRKVDAGDAFAGALAEKYPLFGVSSLPFLADSLAKARSLNKTARPAYESCWPNMARSCSPRRGRPRASGPSARSTAWPRSNH